MQKIVKVPQLQERAETGSNDPGDAAGSEARGGTDEFQNVRRPRLTVQIGCTTLSPYFKGRTDKVEVQKGRKRLTMNSRERQPMKWCQTCGKHE